MRRLRVSFFLALAITGWAPTGDAQPDVEGVEERELAVILQGERVFAAQVVRVVSGDVVIVDPVGKGMTICLAGVDAPEDGQPFAQEARRYASELLLGKAVTVRVRGLDAPSRCDAVGRVLLREDDVAAELLRAGLAWYCERSALPSSALPAAEAEARAAERGLWSDSAAVPPWVFRGAATCLEQGGT